MKKIKNRTLSQKVLKQISAKIVERLNPEKIVLFGSYAYGSPHRNSDLDLFIILRSKERPAKRRIKVSRLFWKREMPMDFIVKTPSEVNRRLAMGDFFVQKILEKGKVLYEKKVA